MENIGELKHKIERMKKDLRGLVLILEDTNGMIATDYVIEKLKRIHDGIMNFHPTIRRHLKICIRCNEDMHEAKEDENYEIKCPHCGEIQVGG